MWVGGVQAGSEDEEGSRQVWLIAHGEGGPDIGRALGELGWWVRPMESAALAPEDLLLEPAVVVARVDLAEGADLDLLDVVARGEREIPVVLVRGPEDPLPMLERWRRGAHDIVLFTDGEPARLAEALERAWQVSRRSAEETRARIERDREQRRVLARQRVELRHLRRKARSVEAQLQVALALAEDGTRAEQALAVALRDQRTQAERACREWGDVLRDVAQEVRVPLNDIVGAVGHVLDGEVHESVCEQALQICASARSLARLVRDLEELAAVEDGTDPVVPRESDVVWLTSHLAERLQHARGIDVDLQICAGAGEVLVDARHLHRVLLRMLLSEESLPDGGRLHIRAELHADAVDICLSPVAGGPRTWRVAELLRQQGGSLARNGEALHLRLPAAQGEAPIPLQSQGDRVVTGAEHTQEFVLSSQERDVISQV